MVVLKKQRTQHESFEMWTLSVNTEELEMIRLACSGRALRLEEEALTGYHPHLKQDLAKRYRTLTKKIGEQFMRQTCAKVEPTQ